MLLRLEQIRTDGGRSNEDKQRAVRAALEHPKAAGLSDNQIAKHVGVDHLTVAAYRASILGNSQDTRTVTRNGTTYKFLTTLENGEEE